MYNNTVPGGRPTTDPKGTLVAVRFSDRQLVPLQRRAAAEGISLSEAVRRCVDQWAERQPRTRPPTPEERQTFKQLFSLFEANPSRRRPRRRK